MSGFKKRNKQRKRDALAKRNQKAKEEFAFSMTRSEIAELYERSKPKWTEFQPMPEEEVTKRGADEGYANSRYAVFVYQADNNLSRIQNWGFMLDEENAEKMKEYAPEDYERYFNPENATGYIHLSIRSMDNDHLAHDWRDLMRIKNELVGPSREAVEIYPAMDRIHDTANQFHLWVLPDGELFPAGWLNAEILHKHQITNSKNKMIRGGRQRAFEEGFLGDFEEVATIADPDNHPGFQLETVERLRARLEEE